MMVHTSFGQRKLQGKLSSRIPRKCASHELPLFESQLRNETTGSRVIPRQPRSRSLSPSQYSGRISPQTAQVLQLQARKSQERTGERCLHESALRTGAIAGFQASAKHQQISRSRTIKVYVLIRRFKEDASIDLAKRLNDRLTGNDIL